MTSLRFWIGLVVLYSFTTWQLLLDGVAASSSAASSPAVLSTTYSIPIIGWIAFFLATAYLLLILFTVSYLLIKRRCASAEVKAKKVKPNVGPKSNIDDPKMMSTTNGQVESSASTTTTGVV